MPASLTPTTLHPFNGLDVPTLLAHRAARRAGHPFMVWEPFDGEPETWTYGRFHHEAVRISASQPP